MPSCLSHTFLLCVSSPPPRSLFLPPIQGWPDIKTSRGRHQPFCNAITYFLLYVTASFLFQYNIVAAGSCESPFSTFSVKTPFRPDSWTYKIPADYLFRAKFPKAHCGHPWSSIFTATLQALTAVLTSRYRLYFPLQAKYTVPAHKAHTARLMDVRLNTFSEDQFINPATLRTRSTLNWTRPGRWLIISVYM
jgi:hypothetical protein